MTERTGTSAAAEALAGSIGAGDIEGTVACVLGSASAAGGAAVSGCWCAVGTPSWLMCMLNCLIYGAVNPF